MQNRRVYFTAQTSAGGCQCEIRVNDVPVLELREGESLTEETPLNQYIFTGPNTLTFILSPLEAEDTFDETARCESIFYRRPTGSPQEQRVPLGGMAFRAKDAKNGTGLESSPDFADSDPPVVSQAPNRGLRAERRIDLDTPFPAWPWLNSQTISNTPETRNELVKVYRDFWNRLAQRDIEGITRLTTLRARALASAYYLTEADAHHELEFRKYLSDPNYLLDQFIEDDARVEVFGRGRLACLVDINGNSPIDFIRRDRTLASYLHLVYCRTLADGWVQTPIPHPD